MKAIDKPNVITTAAQLTAMVDDYLGHPAFCYDVETAGDTRLDPRRNVVEVMSLATDGRHDVVPMAFGNGDLDWVEFPLTASGKARQLRVEAEGKVFTARKSDLSVDASKATYHFHAPPAHLDRRQAFDILRPLLMSDRLKVGHHVKFDLGSVRKYLGTFPSPPYADTMVAAYLIDSGWHNEAGTPGSPYSLAATSYRETGYYMHKGVGNNIKLHPWDAVMRYAAIDAKYTWLTWRSLRRQLNKDGLQDVMALEMEILEVLLAMEHTGAPMDYEHLKQLEHRLINQRDGMLLAAEANVYKAAGRHIQLGSTDAKSQALFGPKEEGFQGLQPTVMLPSGKASVARDAIKQYRYRNKVVGAILDYSDLAKIHSTYVRPYLYGATIRGVADPQPLILGGRIHADFVQNGAATGRFACRAPNLQNVPNANTEMGRELRGLFIAPPGCKLIVADFSQIELRVLAHFSQDPTMMRAFLEGQDIHDATAETVGATRAVGKAINFAVVYGAGDEKVADMAGISAAKAGKFLQLYDERFPLIKQWKHAVVTECRRQQPVPYVRTIKGRIRYLADINNAEDRGFQAAAERQAANTIVQGSAADIIKIAMVRAFRTLPEDCPLILTVHDELVAYAPIASADKAATLIAEAMQGAYPLRVPIPAVLAIVDRWSDAKS